MRRTRRSRADQNAYREGKQRLNSDGLRKRKRRKNRNSQSNCQRREPGALYSTPGKRRHSEDLWEKTYAVLTDSTSWFLRSILLLFWIVTSLTVMQSGTPTSDDSGTPATRKIPYFGHSAQERVAPVSPELSKEPLKILADPLSTIVSARTVPVTGIVLHHTFGGNVSGAKSTLSRKNLCYHYILDRDAGVHEVVAPDMFCSHTSNANKGTIGISYVGGREYDPPKAGQVSMSINLIIELLKRFPEISWISSHELVGLVCYGEDPGERPEPRNVDMQKVADKVGLKLKRDFSC